MSNVAVRDPFSDLPDPVPAPGRDPFEDPDAPAWPRTFATEAEFLEAARELLVCADCERSVQGDHGDPCEEQTFVSGCTFWQRRTTA